MTNLHTYQDKKKKKKPRGKGEQMKILCMAVNILMILLIILTPSISAIQCSTIVEADTTHDIQTLNNKEKNVLKEKFNIADFPLLKKALKNIQGNNFVQKIKEIIKISYQNLTEDNLRFLLLCSLLAYLITYAAGISLGYAMDIVLFVLTQGTWEFFQATSTALIPSEIVFFIMVAIYDIGMRSYDWPLPDNPGGHDYHRYQKKSEC